MKKMWEILVPTMMPVKINESKHNPVRKRHHKVWDAYVRGISGGLTIHSPTKGQWIHGDILFEERMIPVKICCSELAIKLIAKFTKKHYRQLKVCYYKVSDEVYIE